MNGQKIFNKVKARCIKAKVPFLTSGGIYTAYDITPHTVEEHFRFLVRDDEGDELDSSTIKDKNGTWELLT